MAARRREELLDDKDWKEVDLLNGYAAFIGYISMAVKGLGFLVLTWSTVVLLGGFVSMLHMKDFWCLTFITLVQTVGIFDATVNETLSYMISSVFGRMVRIAMSVIGRPVTLMPSLAKALFRQASMVVQLLLLVIVLFPLVTIYVFGILMSGGISLWRLIDHDYRGGGGGEASNMIPAMDTLYYLVLLQAVLFSYKFILGLTGKRMVKQVAATENNNWKVREIGNYLQETKRRCEKDPSFAHGRNLVTHAVDMIASNSPIDCISGVKMLSAAIRIVYEKFREAEGKKESESDNYHLQQKILIGQRMLIKHLLLSSASSKHILQKLLETLDSRGLHDRDTRHHAARIVEYLSYDINLEQFPETIHHISSLMATFEEYRAAEPYQRDYLFHEHKQSWDARARCLPPSQHTDSEIAEGYRELLMQAQVILWRLTAHKNNSRVMSDTPDLVSKIMAPVTSDLLHNTTGDHDAWSVIVYGSMRVMKQLATAQGETGTKLRCQISRCQGAMSTLWRILNCNECEEWLQTNAFFILGNIYKKDTEPSCREDLVLKRESREDFVRMLVDIFTHDAKSNLVREVAGEALWEVLCFRGGISDATIVIQAGDGDVIDSLTEIIVHDENTRCRHTAAIILEHLYTHYTKDDEYLGKLKKAITALMPEVIGKILYSGQETHRRMQSDQNQCDVTPENDEKDKEKEKFHAVIQSIGEGKLLASLLSLCGTVYSTFMSELAPDLAHQFHTPSFVNKLKEIVVKHSDLTAENLSVLKSIGKMVIAMMKHGSWLIKQEDIESLIEVLSKASKNMLDFDHSMIFRSATKLETMSMLEKRTLASLVKEAKQSYALVLSSLASG